MEQGDYTNNFPTTRSKWQAKVEQQDNELMAWIDEFIESEEYLELLQKNGQFAAPSETAHTRKLFASSRQEKEETDSALSFDHAEDSRKFESFTLLQNKIKGSLTKLKIRNTIANQRMGIEIIRQKILEAKQQYDEYITTAEDAYDNKLNALHRLRRDYKLSIHSAELTPNIIKKLARIDKTKRKLKNNTDKKKIQVVSNILRDMRRDQKEKHIKSQEKKIKRKRRSFSSVNITEDLPTYTNTDFTEVEASHIFDIIEEQEEEDKDKISIISDVQEKEDIKVKEKVKKAPKVAKDKAPKKSKTNTEKSSKKSEKPAAPIEEDIVPTNIPNPNPRRKVVPEYVLTELLENITKLYNYLKEKEAYEGENVITSDILLPYDDGFFSKPDKIIFKDFEPGKRYKKIISIVNGNQVIKKISLDRVIWNTDVEEDLLLEVEAFGVRRVSPGMSFSICLRFAPVVLNKTIDGKIVFITYMLRSTKSQQFVLNVVCVPRCAAVLISPTVISFEEMPIWRARAMMKESKNYKTITIRNSGLKECKVVVTKIFNNQTMEQEWKKIISIIRIDDNSDTEKKHLSSSNLEDPSSADPFPRNLVQQCVENVFNVFKFDRNVFNVMPQSTMVLRCWLRDLTEPGYQVESYNFSIYERFIDGQLYCIGAQDVIVNSETTPHFLTSNVEILDFEVCVYGSAYQLDFDLTNPCKLAHHIRICFPRRMKEYLQSSPSVTTILPNQTIKVAIKFFPQPCILKNNKFYDPEVCLLDFPVYVTVLTKTYEDTPPLRIDVFAAVTESQAVILRFIEEPDVYYEDGKYVYDLGHCSTIETISQDVCIQNISIVPQQFGFMGLPSFVTITPNCGFGVLKPMEQASIRLLISPTKEDVINSSGVIKFRLVSNTVKYCGRLRKRSQSKDLVKKLKEMEDFVCKSQGSTSSKLKEDMQALSEAFKNKSINILSSSKASSQSLERFINAAAVDNEQLINLVKYDIEEEKEVSSKMEEMSHNSALNNMYTNVLNFRFTVTDVIVEFSHQTLCFPSTPCGSYSMMNIDLILHRIKGVKYDATFEIFCNSDQFEVQPSIGRLTNKKKPIWIIARPTIPQSVVEEKTLAMKQLAKETEKQTEPEVPDDSKVPEKKSKKGSKKTKSSAKKSEQLVQIDPAAIAREELYQAEMNVWRTIEPYTMQAMFTCRVNYKSARPEEEIYFKASCQVVAPNFIHDQSYQVLDFGAVIIGSSSTKTIKFKNIQRRNIVIDASLLNPVGPFFSNTTTRPEIPSEYIYSYSVTFEPQEEQAEIEFLDVVSDNTSYPFILRGVGIKPKLVFIPEFTVYRMTVPMAGYLDFSFDIRNESIIKLEIHLQKVCELEGTIPQSEVPKSPKTPKSQKQTKFSLELTSDEINALTNTFDLPDDPTCFQVIDTNENENSYTLEANSKRRITIRFSSNSFAKTTTTYIAKYNILVGQNYIKDIIVVASMP